MCCLVTWYTPVWNIRKVADSILLPHTCTKGLSNRFVYLSVCHFISVQWWSQHIYLVNWTALKCRALGASLMISVYAYHKMAKSQTDFLTCTTVLCCGHTFLRHIDLLHSIACTTVLHCGHIFQYYMLQVTWSHITITYVLQRGIRKHCTEENGWLSRGKFITRGGSLP